MIRQSRMFGWLAAGLLAAVCEPTAFAQDVSGLEGLLSEQIVSTASKHAEGASSAPALSTNISAEDLRMYGIRTVAEAVDFLGIAVGSSDNLSGGEVGARGVLLTGDKGSHFLLLVDGQTMNDPLRGGTTFGPGAGIPIELVDHIEIVVGPGSVLYGSNAMFGIVNVVTKRAKDYSGARVIVESTLPISVRVGAGAGAEFKLFGAPMVSGAGPAPLTPPTSIVRRGSCASYAATPSSICKASITDTHLPRPSATSTTARRASENPARSRA